MSLGFQRSEPKKHHSCLGWCMADFGSVFLKNGRLLLYQATEGDFCDGTTSVCKDLGSGDAEFMEKKPERIVKSSARTGESVSTVKILVGLSSCFSELCHMQKFSDDTAIVGCVRNGQEREYRSLVEDFVEWCTTNHLKLNITKTKEMCIDFRRSRLPQQPISIKGVDVEVVRSYRYLGVHLDERLDWSVNTDMVYKKTQSRLYFLRRLGSFRICQKLLLMFYQSVVASVLFYAMVCWGGSISKRDAGRLDRLVRKAGSVLGLELESLTPLAERRALSKLLHIMDNVHHPLHTTIIRQRSSFSVICNNEYKNRGKDKLVRILALSDMQMISRSAMHVSQARTGFTTVPTVTTQDYMHADCYNDYPQHHINIATDSNGVLLDCYGWIQNGSKICRNCVRIFKLHGMDYCRTP
ncbi:hypothetical protein NFI96_001143 [Prochilodus magdalenae]|nr:hypothetical protein NFI96_001143 [Prochilodus magdalenae]